MTQHYYKWIFDRFEERVGFGLGDAEVEDQRLVEYMIIATLRSGAVVMKRMYRDERILFNPRTMELHEI